MADRKHKDSFDVFKSGVKVAFVKDEDVRDGHGVGHVPFESLPRLHIPFSGVMRLFAPEQDLSPEYALPASLTEQRYPFEEDRAELLPGKVLSVETEGFGRRAIAPPLPLAWAAKAVKDCVLIPREEDCYALWDRYAMPVHIRRHSQRVADLASGIAYLAEAKGVPVSADAVYAAGLLHDLGKSYCIGHGGNHAEVGAAWVMRETRNGPIAQGVLFHVHWPWDEALTADTLLVLMILYADKRVMHDTYVSLDARYADLFERYGINETAKARLVSACEQGKRVEAALSYLLGVNLDEYTAYRGRLVKRA